jgi:DNA-directed DNA polymerase III PolC
LIPLHVHSHFSPLGGLCSPEKILEKAASFNIPSLAITDTNGLYGMMDFLDAAADYNIKPIIGSEVKGSNFRFVALVVNQNGYRALCRLLSALHQSHVQKRDLRDYLRGFENDLILFSDDKELLRDTFSSFSETHKYLEISKGLFTHRDVLWAKAEGIKTLATTRARYIDPEDHFYYKLIRAIEGNTTHDLVDIAHEHNEFCYLSSPEDASCAFSLYPEAIENTYKVAEICSSDWFRREIIFPKFNQHSGSESEKILLKKCHEGISWRYENPSQELKEKILKRLDFELNIVISKGFAAYFLVVEDIIKQCDIYCGRGSAAASIISYILGITHVDPIKEGLFFERFLNMERVDPPDIDIDFPWDQRDDVLNYVFKKYGSRAAMVANHNYLRGKSAAREVAKVFGIKEEEISYVLDRMPRITLDKKWEMIIHHASKIEGIVRHLSVHCGGVVITPRPVSDYVPVEIAKKGVPVIQWEKEQTEAAGLVKIDLLGNRSLAVIRDTLKNVETNYGKKIDYSKFNPIHDPKTKELFTTGDTMGVFYVESPATRLFFKKMKSGEFSHVVIAGSIIRPAANKYANEFIRRLYGGHFNHLHPFLKDILDETYGIMIYQEDVTRVAMKIAGFSASEGNNLRKVLGNKHKEKRLRHYKSLFFTGGKENGVNTSVLDSLWQMILSFAGYSFCKPHSASYALVSFKACYLRAHYPAEFMAAVISNRGGFYSTVAYLDECRRMNLKVLPPDVNYSKNEFTGFRDMIRTGLMQIKHLRSSCTQTICKAQAAGPFKNIHDFLNRINPSFEDSKILAKTRCLHSLKGKDGTKQTHSSLMWEIYYHKAKKEGLIQDGQLPTKTAAVKEYSSSQLVEWENDLLGGCVTFPSWIMYRKMLDHPMITKGSDLAHHIGKKVTLFGKKVTQKRVSTKNGESMCFVSFSDDISIFETVLFPEAFSNFRDLLMLGGTFILEGEVQQEYDAIQVNIGYLRRLDAQVLNKYF